MVKINTALGTLSVQPVDSPDYPGIYVTLERGNKKEALVLLEVDNENKNLMAHIWNPDVPWDDPDVTRVFHEDSVNKMFDEEE